MLNRNWVRAAAAGALGLGLAACTSLPVTTDVNPNMSVANCHTYAFAKEFVANANQPAAYGNPLNAERLRVAIESNLAARGIQRADHASADCVVGYAMGTRQVLNDYYGGFGPSWGLGYGYGWGRRGAVYGAWGWDGPYVSDETRIAVDLFDAKSHTPIWHGYRCDFCQISDRRCGAPGRRADEDLIDLVSLSTGRSLHERVVQRPQNARHDQH
jgi:hypothetical protein